MLPGDARVPAVVVAALLFGLAHRYQGVAGVALTGVVGAGPGWVYVASGSLWPSMALHVLLDLRLLLLPTPEPPTAEPRRPSPDARALDAPTHEEVERR